MTLTNQQQEKINQVIEAQKLLSQGRVYNLPITTPEYFDVQEYINAGLIKPSGLSIILGDRNIGKSTSILKHILEDLDKTNTTMFYARTTFKELESYAISFNNQFGPKYKMTTKAIYKMRREVEVSKKTKEEKTIYVKDKVVGFCGALNGADGWRSANFDSVRWVVVEEFNQIRNHADPSKFLTLWTSILRGRDDVYTILIGNRDDANAPILVDLGVNINLDTDFVGDYVIDILPNDENFKNKCYLIDLDGSRFLSSYKPKIWSAIGAQSRDIGDYFNRGYKSYDSIDCVRITNEMKTAINWRFKVWLRAGRYPFVVGTFENWTVALYDYYDEFKDVPVYVDDAYAELVDGSISDALDFVFYTLKNALISKTLIYDNVEVKERLNVLMPTLSKNLFDSLDWFKY